MDKHINPGLRLTEFSALVLTANGQGKEDMNCKRGDAGNNHCQ